MKTVDEIIYDAITADETLMALTDGRVVSTCFAIPPEQEDNTHVPNIIITDDGFVNNTATKDCVWEGSEDRVQVSVDMAGHDPAEVHRMVRLVRVAVERHVVSLYEAGEQVPWLEGLTATELAWDWMKPCYYQKITYQCGTLANTYDEQEETE